MLQCMTLAQAVLPVSLLDSDLVPLPGLGCSSMPGSASSSSDLAHSVTHSWGCPTWLQNRICEHPIILIW